MKRLATSEDMSFERSLRIAAMTRTQLLDRAKNLPDNSEVIHSWPDGWSVRQPVTLPLYFLKR